MPADDNDGVAVKRELEDDGSDPTNKKIKVDTDSAAKDLLLGDDKGEHAFVQPGTVGVTTINDNDVLSGRGGGTNLHPGNRQFRDLINLYRRDYLKARKNDKPSISRSIVNAIREKHGRFLKKVEKTGLWFEIGDDAAREKTSQALRQRAPEMRKLLLDHEMEGARAQQQMMGIPPGMPGAAGMPAGNMPGGMPMMMPGMNMMMMPNGMPFNPAMMAMPNGMFNPAMMGMPPMMGMPQQPNGGDGSNNNNDGSPNEATTGEGGEGGNGGNSTGEGASNDGSGNNNNASAPNVNPMMAMMNPAMMAQMGPAMMAQMGQMGQMPNMPGAPAPDSSPAQPQEQTL